MGTSRLEGDHYFAGSVGMQTLAIPAGTVKDADVLAGADIKQTKLEHQHRQAYSQESGTKSATETRTVHVVRGVTGAVLTFEAGSITVSTGTATITVDLLKNGVSILTAAIVLDSANAIRIVEGATIDTPALADGDVLEVEVTAADGDGAAGSGVFASLTLSEKP